MTTRSRRPACTGKAHRGLCRPRTGVGPTRPRETMSMGELGRDCGCRQAKDMNSCSTTWQPSDWIGVSPPLRQAKATWPSDTILHRRKPLPGSGYAPRLDGAVLPRGVRARGGAGGELYLLRRPREEPHVALDPLPSHPEQQGADPSPDSARKKLQGPSYSDQAPPRPGTPRSSRPRIAGRISKPSSASVEAIPSGELPATQR